MADFPGVVEPSVLQLLDMLSILVSPPPFAINSTHQAKKVRCCDNFFYLASHGPLAACSVLVNVLLYTDQQLSPILAITLHSLSPATILLYSYSLQNTQNDSHPMMLEYLTTTIPIVLFNNNIHLYCTNITIYLCSPGYSYYYKL